METPTVTVAETQAPSPTAWIDAYVAWATKRSPLTPPHFHENIAYTLAACAIAGRVCTQTPQGRVYPNLYTILLGMTSVYAKSVAMTLSQEVAERAMIDNRIINSVFTPESIVGELAGEKPLNLESLPEEAKDRWKQSHSWGAQRMFRLDEAGIFFNGLKRDYNAGFADLWMQFYDCPATIERTTYKHGLHVIPRPVLSCLFATTPASIGHMLCDIQHWQSGFWPRWNFCVGGGYPEFANAVYVTPPPEVVKPLFALGNDRIGPWTVESPLVIPVDADVYAEYESMLELNRKLTWEGDGSLTGPALGRLHTKRLKLALILTALSATNPKEMRVSMVAWQAAEKAVRQMKLDMAEAVRQAGRTERLTQEERVIRCLEANNGDAAPRTLYKHLHISIDQLMNLLKPMVNLGIVLLEPKGSVLNVHLVGWNAAKAPP